MFSHNTTGGYFTSDDVLSKNADDPDAPLFSKLDQLEDFRDAEGSFQLKLCYPMESGMDNDDDDGGAICNEWIQTSNPATESKITGFTPLHLEFDANGFNESWKGLGKNTKYSQNTFIDDTPGRGGRYSSIGAFQSFESEHFIAGPFPNLTSKVSLYAFFRGKNVLDSKFQL